MASEDANSGSKRGLHNAELTEQQVYDCCACRAFAQLVAGGYGTACRKDLQSVLDYARDIWWSQVSFNVTVRWPSE